MRVRRTSMRIVRLRTGVAGVCVASVVAVSGCVGGVEPATETSRARATAPAETRMTVPVAPHGPGTVAVPSHRLDGNRVASGRGAVPKVDPIEFDVPGTPLWVVGAAVAEEVVWVVALEDGRLVGVTETGGDVVERTLARAGLPPGTPPALLVTGDDVVVLGPPGDIGSLFAYPVPLGSGGLVFLDRDGGLVEASPGVDRRIAVDAIEDAQLVVGQSALAVVLTGPTDRYPHGVLGDRVEADSVTIVDLADETAAPRRVEMPDGLVVEGRAPLMGDADGDGRDEILVTASDATSGARLMLLSDDGSVVAEGDPIGRGSRWRHQIAIGAFGPGGETEVVDVRTPHLGGIVEFFVVDGPRLELVASVEGFSSHVLGSRNLDMALGADADGDGSLEVVVPSQDRTTLNGIRRTPTGAEVAWTVPLGGVLSSNLAAVQTPDGGLHLAGGRADGVVLIWPPG